MSPRDESPRVEMRGLPPKFTPGGEPYLAPFARNVFLLGCTRDRRGDVCVVGDESGMKVVEALRAPADFMARVARFLSIVFVVLSIPLGWFLYSALLGQMPWLSLPIGIFFGLLLFMFGILLWLLINPDRAIEIALAEGTEPVVVMRPLTRFGIPERRYSIDTIGRKRLATVAIHWTKDAWRGRVRVFDMGTAVKGEPMILITEKPAVFLLMRRVAARFLGNRFMTDFDFTTSGEGYRWGNFERRHQVMRCDVLDLGPDVDGAVDRRIALMLAVFVSFRDPHPPLE